MSRLFGGLSTLPHTSRIAFLVFTLISCLLLGCSQRGLQKEKDLLKVGMTKEDVHNLFSHTGRLRENPDRWVCSKGHQWDAKPPVIDSLDTISYCSVCNSPGRKKPDSWMLYERKRTHRDMTYLYITFDSNGVVSSVAISDM